MRKSIYLLLIIPLTLSAFIHLWNPAGFPPQDADEGVYIRRALRVSEGLSPQEPLSYYDHPYFGQIFLGTLFKIIGYPDLFKPAPNESSIVTLYSVPRVLMGILAVIDTFLLYRICERRYNRNVAFIGSTLFAVMPITWLLRLVFLDSILLPFLLASILFAVMIRKSEYDKNKSHRNRYLILLSAIFLGLAIFIKMPVFTMIPLIGYLVYRGSNKSFTSLGLWFIPVILLPLIWPAYALYEGNFDKWVDGVTHQAAERQENHGLYYAVSYFYILDPVLLILGLGSIGFVSAMKRDPIPLLWTVPILLFFYIVHFASVFYFIPVFPVFCLAIGIMIEDISKRIAKTKTHA